MFIAATKNNNSIEKRAQIELNPMHSTYDKRNIHTSFLFEETSIDGRDCLKQLPHSHTINNVTGVTLVGETRLYEEPTPLNLSEMPNVSSAVCSEILSSPYYASLRNSDGSPYESLTDEHQSSSSRSIPTTSAYAALDGYQALYDLHGSLQNPDSSLNLELGGTSFTSKTVVHSDDYL